MLFIETTYFTKVISEYLNDDELSSFHGYLASNPEKGDLIKGSGGMRKIRWFSKGKGKSAGVRIIYYYINSDQTIWLLSIYSKNEYEDISAQVIKNLKKEIEND